MDDIKKIYYLVSEAAEMLGVSDSNIRYWLVKFGLDSQVKRFRGFRKLTKSDLNKLFEIKRLLHDEGYTIRGAKKKMEEYNSADGAGQEKRISHGG